MEKAPNGPASPESTSHVQSERFSIEMAVTRNNITASYYSVDCLITGINADFRHRSWQLLNMNRELPTTRAHMSFSPTSDLELNQPNGVSRQPSSSPAIVMLWSLHLSKYVETEPTQRSARVSNLTDVLRRSVHCSGGSNGGLQA
jgi:hypothetical protein